MEKIENSVCFESHSPSLLERDLAEYCRLQAQVQKAREQVIEFRRAKGDVGRLLDALESDEGWAQLAEDIQASLAVIQE